MSQEKDLSRNEKILITLLRLAKGTKQSIRYEDIVAAVFEKYPKDFQLRGYPQYPDSGDIIHKPLYLFRKKGLVEAGNKMFSLTDYGMEMAKRIEAVDSGAGASKDRLTHFIQKELTRISKLESFQLFTKGKADKLLDTDFYDYLDTTVNSKRNEFIGRLETMNKVIGDLKKIDEVRYKPLIELHEFLLKKFQKEIDYIITH